jgi:hypothetical protein
MAKTPDFMNPFTVPDFSANGNPMAAMAQMSQACAQGYMKWQQEVSRFVSERFAADMRAQQALLACRDPADMLRIQQDWLETTTTAYSDEVKRLSDMAVQISQGTMESMSGGTQPANMSRPPLKSVP